MTLCVVWRENDEVHLASDSRLTIATNSYADVGIKVLSVPFNIYSPTDNLSEARTLEVSGELGMCFAGSAVNSIFVKESIAEVLKELQYAPGYSNISMDGLSQLIFNAYRIISQKVCSSAIGGNGRASLVIAGWCVENKCVRSFMMKTDENNEHSCTEILTLPNQYMLIGSGQSKVQDLLPASPTNIDYLKALKAVIDDSREASVGGSIQYGCFQGNRFKISGIVECVDDVHYWRGALDMNSSEFMGAKFALVPGLKFIDPFNTFAD